MGWKVFIIYFVVGGIGNLINAREFGSGYYSVIYPHITRIWHPGQGITSLSKEYLKSYPNLEKLSVPSNRISSIPEDLFSNSPKLKELLLITNKISSIPEDLFSNTQELIKIGLSENNIAVIPEHLFRNTRNIQKISFSRNKISVIPKNLLKNTPNLRVLSFSGNKISVIPKDLLKNTPNLREFWLDENKITVIPVDLFRSTPRLVYIELEQNDISAVAEETFNNLIELKSLYISDNQLSTISPALFRNSPKLMDLYTYGNNISVLPEEMFGYTPKLDSMMTDNELDCRNAYNWTSGGLRRCGEMHRPFPEFDSPCYCHRFDQYPNVFMKPGESKAVVNVPKPNPRCWDGRAAVVESFVVDPPVDPTQAFSVGYHSFTYTLKLKGRNMDVVCPVAFSVYGKLCRGIAFDPNLQVCCCGKIHTKQHDHNCCGLDYYNTTEEIQCCQNANIISKEESCWDVDRFVYKN